MFIFKESQAAQLRWLTAPSHADLGPSQTAGHCPLFTINSINHPPSLAYPRRFKGW